MMSTGLGKKERKARNGGGKSADGVVSTDDARFRFITLEEAAHRMNMSLRTLEREIKAGRGPKITMISARETRIRLDHFGQHLDESVADKAA